MISKYHQIQYMKEEANCSHNNQDIWGSTPLILQTSTLTKECSLTINTIDPVCQIVQLVVIKDLQVWDTTPCRIQVNILLLARMDLLQHLAWECTTHILGIILQWVPTSIMELISTVTALQQRGTINGINHLSKMKMGVEITTISRASNRLSTQR